MNTKSLNAKSLDNHRTIKYPCFILSEIMGFHDVVFQRTWDFRSMNINYKSFYRTKKLEHEPVLKRDRELKNNE